MGRGERACINKIQSFLFFFFLSIIRRIKLFSIGAVRNFLPRNVESKDNTDRKFCRVECYLLRNYYRYAIRKMQAVCRNDRSMVHTLGTGCISHAACMVSVRARAYPIPSKACLIARFRKNEYCAVSSSIIVRLVGFENRIPEFQELGQPTGSSLLVSQPII